MIKYKDVADRSIKLQEKKNKDYGDAFKELCQEFGAIALVYPLSIKIKRLQTLLGGSDRKVKDETVVDTLIDIMGYAGMGIMAIENNDLKMKEDEE